MIFGKLDGECKKVLYSMTIVFAVRSEHLEGYRNKEL